MRCHENKMIVIIAEKPSAAKKIAYALADKDVKVKREKNVPIYELTINNEKAVVLAAAGHLFGLGEKNKTFSYPVFDIEWKPLYEIDKGAKHTKNFIEIIKKFSSTDKVVVACDYDIEGELIGKNIVVLVMGKNDAYRMKFSTLTPYELKKSFLQKSSSLDWGLAKAGEARHILDWFYGINLSRALMTSVKKEGIYKVLSIGRVQGPALKIIVDREKEIESFIPTPYWEMKAKINGNIVIPHEKEKFLDKKEATKILNKLTKLKHLVAVAKDVEKKEKRIMPPVPFDLTTLQTEAYRLFRYSPAKTLNIAQNLYLGGYISYPRTSSQKLPPSIGYKKILKRLIENYNIGVKEGELNNVPVQGKKVDPAHPAIYPTGILPEKLSREEKNIYELIVKRFVSAFMKECIRSHTKVYFDVGGETFVLTGTTTISEGWTKVYPASFKEEEVPDIKKGEKYNVNKIWLDEKHTQPPKRYTQASLVKELEKRGLGTKATRALIVKTLYDRGYIEGESIKPTALGKKIVEIFEKYSHQITDEELTRHFEKEMEDIREGKKQVEEVINEAKQVLVKILKEIRENEGNIGKDLIEATKESEKEKNSVGTCPHCGGNLTIKTSRTKNKFIACENYPNCNFTVSLPRGVSIKTTKKKCKSCGWPIIKMKQQRQQKKKSISRFKEICINPDCPTKQQAEELKKEIEKACPKCGSKLVIRKSLYGSFISCSNWPKCKYTAALTSRENNNKKQL